MRRIKLGLGLVAVLVFGIAMTGSASASSFLTTVTGATLLSEKVKTQIFTTEEGKVECGAATIVAGKAGTAGKEESEQKATIKYGSCTAFGFVTVEITNAAYDFHANGEVRIEKTIEITVPLTGCKVTVGEQNTKSTGYATKGSNIELIPNVTGISYSANSSCSKPGSFTNGTYTGTSEVMISGGSLSFMA